MVFFLDRFVCFALIFAAFVHGSLLHLYNLARNAFYCKTSVNNVLQFYFIDLPFLLP